MSLIDNVLLGTYVRTRRRLSWRARCGSTAPRRRAPRAEALHQLKRVGLGDKPLDQAGNCRLAASASSKSPARLPPIRR